jgi:hypothetical protein
LVANVPVIEKGSLPILVPAEQRLDYIESLATWQLASGTLRSGSVLEGDQEILARFHAHCAEWMTASSALMDEALELQRQRWA